MLLVYGEDGKTTGHLVGIAANTGVLEKLCEWCKQAKINRKI
jgi:hypothetical protein